MPRSRFDRGRRGVDTETFEEWLTERGFMVTRTIGEPLDLDNAPDPEDKETIQVKSVELNIKSNTEAHNTDKFDITETKSGQIAVLVVRRGQAFGLNVDFNRGFNASKDELRIVFEFGDTPSSSRGTHVEIKLSAEDILNDWGAIIKKNNGNTLYLQIMTPPNIPIGKWRFAIDVVKKANETAAVHRSKEKNPIYILFNPWCKDDQVYLSDEKLLDEYILNETGHIFVGNHKRKSAKPWSFNQFDGVVLDCCLYLLDQTELKDYAKGDPIKVSRKISAMVNAPDDGGVLIGNWSGNYTGGTSPSSWPGSGMILEEYHKGKRPVKFGQCWVFSGVVTTVCRALGIPARSTTNFSSAHDTDGSMTIDHYVDSDGDPINFKNDDSVWNFHVWNDVWMARPDLPVGYGGWQAIDATPQETSEGIYCSGPMSLLAVKRGEVNFPFDGPFTFAEVNADKVTWLVIGREKEIMNIQKNSVGKFLSTQRPGVERSPGRFYPSEHFREDVTILYKFAEGSEEERIAVMKANLHSTIRGDVDHYRTTAKDVDFELILNDDTFVGDDIKVDLKMRNNSSETRTVKGRITVTSVQYTGVRIKDVKKVQIHDTKMRPNSEETFSSVISVDDHIDKITDQCFLKIYCMTNVVETKQLFTHADDLRLRKPHLTIKGPDNVTVGRPFEIEISFVNPMPQTLTNCEVVVDSPGIQKAKIYRQPNVEARQTYVGKFELKPFKAGKRTIVVSFDCAQLTSVNGSHEVKVSY